MRPVESQVGPGGLSGMIQMTLVTAFTGAAALGEEGMPVLALDFIVDTLRPQVVTKLQTNLLNGHLTFFWDAVPLVLLLLGRSTFPSVDVKN